MDENKSRLTNSTKSKMKFLIFVFLFLVIFAIGFFVLSKSGWLLEIQNYTNGKDLIIEGVDSGEIVDSDYVNVPEFEGSIHGRLDNNDTPVEYKAIDGTKRVGDVEFSNIKIGKISDDRCVVTADVKNLSREFSKAEKVSVKVLDEDGEVKESFGGILTELAGLEPNKFKTYVLADITYASDINFVVVQNE